MWNINQKQCQLRPKLRLRGGSGSIENIDEKWKRAMQIKPISNYNSHVPKEQRGDIKKASLGLVKTSQKANQKPTWINIFGTPEDKETQHKLDRINHLKPTEITQKPVKNGQNSVKQEIFSNSKEQSTIDQKLDESWKRASHIKNDRHAAPARSFTEGAGIMRLSLGFSSAKPENKEILTAEKESKIKSILTQRAPRRRIASSTSNSKIYDRHSVMRASFDQLFVSKGAEQDFGPSPEPVNQTLTAISNDPLSKSKIKTNDSANHGKVMLPPMTHLAVQKLL